MKLRSCPVPGCKLDRKPDKAMCLHHWLMVPKDLQARLWATFRVKPLGKEWVEAFRAAVDAAVQVDVLDSERRKAIGGIRGTV